MRSICLRWCWCNHASHTHYEKFNLLRFLTYRADKNSSHYHCSILKLYPVQLLPPKKMTELPCPSAAHTYSIESFKFFHAIPLNIARSCFSLCFSLLKPLTAHAVYRLSNWGHRAFLHLLKCSSTSLKSLTCVILTAIQLTAENTQLQIFHIIATEEAFIYLYFKHEDNFTVLH